MRKWVVTMDKENITINCCDGVPNEIASFLEERYHCSFTTKLYCESAYRESLYTCFIREKSELKEVLIYSLKGKKCYVRNRIVDINEKYIESFKKYLFSINSRIKSIYFFDTIHPIVLPGTLSFLSQNDVCIILPTSKEDYNRSLGSKSRQHYKYYLKKIKEDFKDVEICINKPYEKENDGEFLKELNRLKELRCNDLHEKNLVNENLDQIDAMSSKYGRISYIVIDKQIVGILLFYKIITDYYFIQVAFDSKYYRYSVGRLLLYQSILSSIDEKCSSFHFLWGGSDYKNHYSAASIELYTSIIFREKRFLFLFVKINIVIKMCVVIFKNSKIGKMIKPYYKYIRFMLFKH